MALQSPGVQVTVTDESFYTPADGGTTPLIVVATAQDKQNASATGIAQGTLAANVGKVYRVSSQRELVDFFGTPIFKQTVSGSPRNADEQNEYGLQAAYSFLGVANSAYVVRADIDLNELTAQATVPGADPFDGQYWLDTQSTNWGIFEWDGNPVTLDGQAFSNKAPIIINATDTDKLSGTAPATGVGRVGDYAIVTVSDVVRIYYKGVDYTTVGNPISWNEIGTKGWRKTWAVFTADRDGHSAQVAQTTFEINGTTVTLPAGSTVDNVVTIVNNLNIQGVKAAKVNSKFTLFITDTVDDGLGDSTDSNVIVLADGSASINALFGTAGGVSAGNYYGPELQMSPHTSVPQWKSSSQLPRPSGSVWVKTTEPNQGARWRVKLWDGATETWVESLAPLYLNPQTAIFNLDRTTGGESIPKDTLFVQYNYTEDSGYDNTPQTGSFKIFTRKATGNTSITSGIIDANTFGAGSYTINIKESITGQAALSSATAVTFTAAGAVSDANTVVTAINNAQLNHVEAEVVSGRVVITHNAGGEIRFEDVDSAMALMGYSAYDYSTSTGTTNLYAAPQGDDYDFVASNWLPLAGTTYGYIASNDAPQNDPSNGQRWYSSLTDEVDIMVHNGSTWVGYQDPTSPFYSASLADQTDPAGPIVSPTRPVEQSDGTPLKTGDIWIDTSDLENYPVIYKYNNDLSNTPIANRWRLVDKADASSEDGVVIADARWGTDGTKEEAGLIKDLLTSNYIDPDAPDPALYPAGIILFNTRRSGFNIKVYRENYIDQSQDNVRLNNQSMASYATDRWVTDSGEAFGRKAQRQSVIEKLKATISTNSQIREDEVRQFNLISCPGYPEVTQNLVDLNTDRGTTAFIVADSPFRLQADTQSLVTWGQNQNGATDNGDEGLVTFDEYTGVFYPSGLTTDNTGNTIVVPSSHMMLKTIALSDQVSYPWFAPAGIRRGGISNATSVGYVDRTTGDFQSVALTDAQRNTLYDIKVNPITFFNGVGLVNYGQRTRASGDSALDRINVARLVIYLRTQLNRLAKPFVFEPNDKITRDEIKQAVESLLLELVGLRALYDFAVVCDESNNTAARIDRNELYVDIAIEPVKSIEFIYIPLRLKNTGEIQGQASA